MSHVSGATADHPDGRRAVKGARDVITFKGSKHKTAR